MKGSWLIALVTLVIAFSSCKKDTGDCLRDDFIGTYVGITICGTQRPVDAIVIASAGSAPDELNLDLEGATVMVKVDGCSFSGEVIADMIDFQYEGELDANKITVNLKGNFGAIELDCKTEAVK